MSEYVIVTDSSADLSAELVEQLELSILPLAFILKGKTYRDYPDRREMPIGAIYTSLREGEMVTTAAVNVAEYQAHLEPILAAGKDVLVLAFSSGLSTTCNSARIAAQELAEAYPERKILVVDTLCASLGQGLLVWYAARMRQSGKSIEEVRDWAEANKLHLCHWFTVDDLHFLKRGGRVSAATAVVGTMLQIKPRAPCGQRGAPHQHGQGPGPEGRVEGPGGPYGADRHRSGRTDRLYQPRRLPGGCTVCGSGGLPTLWNPPGAHCAQRDRPGHRGPRGSGHSGPLLLGKGASERGGHQMAGGRGGDPRRTAWRRCPARLTMNGVPGLVIEDEAEFHQFFGEQPAVLGLCGRRAAGAE